jgi:hypothetical protein
MNRVTLAVVTVLLAVPAAAGAKAGIEWGGAIETQKAGDRQNFSAIVMNEPSDPMGGAPTPIEGVRPLVTFRNTNTGEVIRVRTTTTSRNGESTGSVVFPNRGPWTADLSVNGKSFGPGDDRGFRLAPAATAPSTPPAQDPGGDGFPAWLLTLPAAALAALGIWFVRRRPRELGT